MVEGPGCKVKGETLKPRVRGQILKSVGGNVMEKYKKKGKQKKPGSGQAPDITRAVPPSPYDVMIGARCSDIQTLGKEFFMFFEGVDMCLRVHFLMAGGFRVNGAKLDHEGDSEAQSFTIVLQFNKDLVTFHKSAADMRSAAECVQKMKSLRSVDICDSGFSHQRATELVGAQMGRMVCDVLLDQLVLPGVGNIIKNEALFDSGIHPDTKVEQLSSAHVSHLVKMTRDFSMIFYKCRKEGKSLNPYLKIYRKGQCKQCHGKTVTTRLGDDMNRLSTFCSNCQTNDVNKLRQWKLPVKNSLLGWISSSKMEVKKEDWSCNLCTLINAASRSTCAACGVAREDPLVERLTTETSGGNGSGDYKSGDLLLGMSVTRNLCGSSGDSVLTTPRNKRLRSDEDWASSAVENCSPSHATFEMDLMESPEFKKLKSNSPSRSSSHLPSTQNRLHLVSHSISNTSVRTLVNKHNLKDLPSSVKNVPPQGQVAKTAIIPATLCSTHKKKCTMREVRKESQNKGRMFHACPLRNCNFFVWADESFPICEGHGKRCAIRTVMKQGANNGRRFFACSQGKKKTCEFFQWADQYNEAVIR